MAKEEKTFGVAEVAKATGLDGYKTRARLRKLDVMPKDGRYAFSKSEFDTVVGKVTADLAKPKGKSPGKPKGPNSGEKTKAKKESEAKVVKAAKETKAAKADKKSAVPKGGISGKSEKPAKDKGLKKAA